jgi:threonine aldolase
MLLHMDGARVANAAVSLQVTLSAITRDVGVDVLSFGGAKNGMMYGEAVIFFDRSLAKDFKYTRKQGTHLPSKMRFVSAQFTALLSNDLWRNNAAHANGMAKLLAQEAGIKLRDILAVSEPATTSSGTPNNMGMGMMGMPGGLPGVFDHVTGQKEITVNVSVTYRH